MFDVMRHEERPAFLLSLDLQIIDNLCLYGRTMIRAKLASQIQTIQGSADRTAVKLKQPLRIRT